MYRVINYFAIFSALILLGCTQKVPTDSDGLIGEWSLKAITYSDGESRQMESGNMVEFTSTDIVESIKGYGKRRYSYSREDNVLVLTSGADKVVWSILSQQQDVLNVETPIGVYQLAKH
ncbi:hypothetical protein KO528_07550 [Saccharophagus degradans]|uniref:hypothetical protein n=1 Tax=Saccharophagus degradans TaxID=86304 RepID=UPI001C09C1A5|nr:hypothetical protein [Saccharophagus degradans]MBU2985201.1 hypothetical protein [Saccharophagus degradans]